MADNSITIKMTRNAFLKAKEYQVTLNGKDQQRVNYQNFTTAYKVKPGKYTIEVKNSVMQKEEDIQLVAGQQVLVTINPAVPYGMAITFLFVLATAAIVAQVMIMSTLSIPLLFIPIVPFIFLKKRHFPDKFLVSVSTKEL